MRRVPQLGEGKIYGSTSAFYTLYTFYTANTATEKRRRTASFLTVRKSHSLARSALRRGDCGRFRLSSLPALDARGNNRESSAQPQKRVSNREQDRLSPAKRERRQSDLDRNFCVVCDAFLK